jgi:hypothetical protein
MNETEKRKLDAFIENYSVKVIEGNASLFVGSGFSREAKLPVWSELLSDFAKEIKLDVSNEHDLISLAQYYVNAKKRTKLNDKIRERFSYSCLERDLNLPNHEILATLPIKNVWTTNYDQLLEETLKKHNVTPICLTDDDTIQRINSKRSVVVHKIHGDADSPNDCVITKADYDLYSQTHEMILAKLKAEMCYNTFLFLGYSFNDTNIQHILSRIRAVFGSKSNRVKSNKIGINTHYCIFAKCSRQKDNPDYDYNYDNQRLKHHVADLRSYGIETILLDDYTHLYEVLSRIRNRVFQKHVFISGSYPSDLDVELKSKIQKCARTLSTHLISQNFKIYSGYGMNLGVDVVEGAHDGCAISRVPGNEKEVKWLNDHLLIYPFPYSNDFGDNEKAREDYYAKWRKNIIEHTQITIVISGIKKSDDGKFDVADGVLKEVEISKKQGNLIIPIPFTGGAAKYIHDEMRQNGDEYANSDLFKALNDADKLQGTLVGIIDKYALNH